MSWIALDDLLGILLESIANPRLQGPVNAVAPENVTNRDFSTTLANVLHRPSFMKAPAFAMRLAGGQMVDELVLFSQRVQPLRLQDEGFPFALPALEMTLRHELGRFGRTPIRLAAETASSSSWLETAHRLPVPVQPLSVPLPRSNGAARLPKC